MQINGILLGKSTPAFSISEGEHSVLRRAWGASYLDGTWLFPAYAPFAQWVFSDIRKMYPTAHWDDRALDHLKAARDDLATWTAAEIAYYAGNHVEIDLDFPDDFTPYRHQPLGMQRIVSYRRSLILWDMGTGKTRTVSDGLRLLRKRGEFNKALVIAPPVVLDSWKRDALRCTSKTWKVVEWDGSRKAVAAAQDADMVLASYDRVRIEKDKADHAAKELRIPDAKRLQYNLPLLTAEQVEQYRWDVQHHLYQLDYDMIIADESHYMGNWESGRTQAAIELSAKASRRLCLTGTFGDDPRKAYAQLYFLSPALVPMPYRKFVDHHVVFSKFNKHIVRGFRLLNELNDRVNQIAIRMKKSECIDLPPLVIEDRYFDMGPTQRARYNELVLKLRTSVAPMLAYMNPAALEDQELPVSEGRNLANGADRSNKLLQVVSGFVTLGADTSVCDECPYMLPCVESKIRPYTKKCKVYPETVPKTILRDMENPKLDLFKSTLVDILEADPTNKVIVWSNRTAELEDIQEALKAIRLSVVVDGVPVTQKIAFVRVDGKTSNKSACEDKFQTDPNCRVYFSQVSTGIGITLTAANYTIYYSVPWDPLQYRQSMDRAYRIGQKRPMTVLRLLTSNATYAMDRFVATVLEDKKRISLTIAERVVCAQCDQQALCAQNGTLPFQATCLYAAAVDKPSAPVEVIEGEENHEDAV